MKVCVCERYAVELVEECRVADKWVHHCQVKPPDLITNKNHSAHTDPYSLKMMDQTFKNMKGLATVFVSRRHCTQPLHQNRAITSVPISMH